MSVQAIPNSQAWARFQAITEAARMRNSALNKSNLSAAAPKTGQPAAAAKPRGAATVGSLMKQYGVSGTSVQGRTEACRQKVSVGRMFDAYA